MCLWILESSERLGFYFWIWRLKRWCFGVSGVVCWSGSSYIVGMNGVLDWIVRRMISLLGLFIIVM